MPVPKRKRSRARRDSRFANKGLKVKSITGCLHCKAPLATHQVCKECGFYKGIKVLRTKGDRVIDRAQVRQAKIARKSERSVNEEQSE